MLKFKYLMVVIVGVLMSPLCQAQPLQQLSVAESTPAIFLKEQGGGWSGRDFGFVYWGDRVISGQPLLVCASVICTNKTGFYDVAAGLIDENGTIVEIGNPYLLDTYRIEEGGGVSSNCTCVSFNISHIPENYKIGLCYKPINSSNWAVAGGDDICPATRPVGGYDLGGAPMSVSVGENLNFEIKLANLNSIYQPDFRLDILPYGFSYVVSFFTEDREGTVKMYLNNMDIGWYDWVKDLQGLNGVEYCFSPFFNESYEIRGEFISDSSLTDLVINLDGNTSQGIASAISIDYNMIGRLKITGIFTENDLRWINNNLNSLKYLDLSDARLPNGRTETEGFWYFMENTNITKLLLPSNITKLSEQSFCVMRALKEVSLPSTLLEIGPGAFFCNTAMTTIYSYNPEPPILDGDPFNSTNPFKITLYVPKGSKSKYMSCPAWNEFGRIVEFESGVEISTIDSNEEKDNSEIFTVTGIKIQKTDDLKGLYIIKDNKGARKVIF